MLDAVKEAHKLAEKANNLLRQALADERAKSCKLHGRDDRAADDMIGITLSRENWALVNLAVEAERSRHKDFSRQHPDLDQAPKLAELYREIGVVVTEAIRS